MLLTMLPWNYLLMSSDDYEINNFMSADQSFV